MPINLFKYAIALIATAVILFVSARVILKTLKKAGILKKKQWKENKEEEPPLE